MMPKSISINSIMQFLHEDGIFLDKLHKNGKST